MKQLTFLDEGRLDWRDAPEPELRGDEEALVRPLTVATCDLDRAIVAGLVPVAAPFPFGHGCVAELSEVGEASTAWRRGGSSASRSRSPADAAQPAGAVTPPTALASNRWPCTGCPWAPTRAGSSPTRCGSPTRTRCWCPSPTTSHRRR